MKQRLVRLKTIRKIIKTDQISSQDELLSKLAAEGFSVTQATLSRDLKFLRVSKVLDLDGAYLYTLPLDSERQESESMYIEDFQRGYVSIDWSHNIVVIKTSDSHAGTVAQAVDNLALASVLGCVAGADDTVFVCLREGSSGEDFMAQMSALIPELNE
jgi:transcriptional regulator of arginine metabolism